MIRDVKEIRSPLTGNLVRVQVESGATMLEFVPTKDRKWVEKVDAWPTDGRRISCRDDLRIPDAQFKQASAIANERFQEEAKNGVRKKS